MAGHRASQDARERAYARHFVDDVAAPSVVSARRPSPASALRLAIAPRGRRLDDDRLAGIDLSGVGARKPLNAAVVASHGVLADLAGFASGQAERTHPAVARQNRAIHLLQKTDRAAHAVAGIPAAASARTFTDLQILEQGRVAALQHLPARP